MYVGVTNDLSRRLSEHKAGAVPGFTKAYNVTKLVYVEEYASIADARARERQLKHWRREWKFELIEADNPTLARSQRHALTRGSAKESEPGSRVSSATLHVALHPGHEAEMQIQPCVPGAVQHVSDAPQTRDPGFFLTLVPIEPLKSPAPLAPPGPRASAPSPPTPARRADPASGPTTARRGRSRTSHLPAPERCRRDARGLVRRAAPPARRADTCRASRAPPSPARWHPPRG